MLRFLLVGLLFLHLPVMAAAQDLQAILQTHAEEVAKPSRRSVGVVLDDLIASANPAVPEMLRRWQAKELYRRDDDGLFFYVEDFDDTLNLIDIETGEIAAADISKDLITEIKPNGGVRREIGTALVQFELSDPNPTQRARALAAIGRNMEATHLDPLLASLEGEDDLILLDRKKRLITYLSARFAEETETRIAAIEDLADDLSVEGRAALSQILRSDLVAIETLPEDANIARKVTPGSDELSTAEAYAMLVAEDAAPPLITNDAIRAALTRHIMDGRVGGVALQALDTWPARYQAYDALVAEGLEPPGVTEADVASTLENWTFAEIYDEDDPAITDAAQAAQATIETRVVANQMADLGLDAISLASIYFLAAIGLAITFGVMGVINMAHGEFIMMGAYTGYVLQLIIPDYTLSLIVALPTAFAITFAAGVAMERLVIRWLYDRPLETLLATFGISIALQQLAKNIFGTQARPLTSPDWLDGTWVINEVVQISYIRIAIFVLALLFLGLLLFILNKTRLGLEVRAVTQNPRMAAAMGINPDKIKMLTFGLGSGIAGIAGVAIGLYAKVTSEMGSEYIVQSFMTVVVGGVGNVWGTLAGAGMIGILQKGIEWLNPSNTLAAQTYMILFIILFIQFRPKGIFALKGRAAGD
ncbi:urea ABC transporter permease subunit UrtB [Yoonia sp. 2307UL14-13]|uniref:urea ABC transporter permease subunit UrtB n=1 Tax=Yoonia sp. 2307UL14-13 TaxID=3126506 RepID=UPI0030A678ED